MTTGWILGNQLHPETDIVTDTDRVLIIESRALGEKRPYHVQKLTVLYSAMRHFRDSLRDDGYEVAYYQTETFEEGLKAYFEEYDDAEIQLMRPPTHGSADRLTEIVEEQGGSLEIVENEMFISSREEWNSWYGGDGESFKQEDFYRFMRRKTGYLMYGDAPEGGDWNYDDENRETPPADYEPPEIPKYEPDEMTETVREWVDETFETWGGGELIWPVTREEALDSLDDFIENRLEDFGVYQDAMVSDKWAMNHGLLSSSINLGLLHPEEVVKAVVDAYNNRDEIPINSAEGFIRQVMGWREFMRHVYRERMPEMGSANKLDATYDLPEAYYTSDTDMECLKQALDAVWEYGYSHHIQRLMVLSNFALIYGADPHEYNEWFNFAYIDAYHWVTTPNVVGMGVYADDSFVTKPYASSANYIDKMSDHCSECKYDPDKTTGEDACPFNALYWDFLDENEEPLRSNYRMSLVYSHLDNKDDEEMQAIKQRVETIRELADAGEL